MSTDLLEQLPASVRGHLATWQRALVERLGKDLVGIVMHGSAARGDYRPGESDIDVVVVLKKTSFDVLSSLGDACQIARFAARIEPMFLLEDELAPAADAFPLFYADIQGTFVLLEGENPFAKLDIQRKHLRVRIEQELREAQIRLRRATVEANGDEEVIALEVDRKVKQIRSPLAALLGLHGKKVGPSLRGIVEAAGKHYDVKVAPLLAPSESPEKAHQRLVALLDAAIRDADSLPEGAP